MQGVVFVRQFLNAIVVDVLHAVRVDVDLGRRPTGRLDCCYSKRAQAQRERDSADTSTSFWMAFIFQTQKSSKSMSKFLTQPSAPAT